MNTKPFRNADLFVNRKTCLVALMAITIQLLDSRAQTATTLGTVSVAADLLTTTAAAPTNQNLQVVGQVPKDWRPGTGTTVTGAAAEKAKAAALAKYPKGTVDRVLKLGDGSYAVHMIKIAWPHHVFVDKEFRFTGAVGVPAALPGSVIDGHSAAAWLNQMSSPLEGTSAIEIPSNSLTSNREDLLTFNLNNDAFVTLGSTRHYATNSAWPGPFAIPGEDVDALMTQGPKHAKRLQFLGGDNPVDELEPFGERNDGPSGGWLLFSIHF